jgi:predicted CopG family antitoxin
MIKTSISIPDDIYTEAKRVTDNFSLLVSEALKEYLRKKNIKKAISSFGKWQKRDKDSIEIVNELRKEESRKYASRND